MSTPELVHPVPVEDARAWLDTLAVTFLDDPHDEKFEKRLTRWTRQWEPERTWAHRDRGRYVATLATEERTLTVPGPAGATRDLTVDALTAVTVAATHRRQGLLSAMLGASLTAARERGDALSALIAAEWPIYGRFGYAPAVDAVGYTYYPRKPHAALPSPPPGRVYRVEAADLRETAPAVFDAARRQRAGQIDRRHPWWDRRLNVDGYEPLDKQPTWYVHEGDDGPDGVLAWSATRDFTLTGELGAIKVDEFFAANDTAYRELWGYLAGIDVVEEIFIDDRPLDEPIRWALRDARALTRKHHFDFLWVRLLDVPAALSARAYATSGQVVLDVVDQDYGGFAAGRYLLEATDADAKCTVTTEPADVRLSQQALASAYLGGFPLSGRAHAGDVEELTPQALARVDAMFRTPLAPWCQTGF